ncbi:unnamed protein product, partial [Hapterophycus canaliculatus]
GNVLHELAQAWAKDDRICTLDLSARKIAAREASELADALRVSLSITSVNCSLNSELRDEGAKLLAPTLRDDGTGISTVRSLNLMRCGIGDIGATALAHGLRGNSVLEQLNLTGNRIGDAGVIALMGSLVGPSAGFLFDLWLSSNYIRPAGAEGMGLALAKSPALRSLHLTGNNLRDEGVVALVKGAVAGGGLRGLFVSGCGVSDTGAKEIANSLMSSLHLETLCLGYNSVGDDGASALARVVAENQSLRRLLLPCNGMKAAGGRAMAAMLLSNRALLCLDISNNPLGATGIVSVASAIAKNVTLLELDLSACGGTDASFQAVSKAVEVNNTLGVLSCAGNHLSIDSLAEIDYAMGRPKKSVRELVGQVKQSTDKQEALSKRKETKTKVASVSHGVGPSVQLVPGQETSIQVSLGRKDNTVGSITVTNETCLEEARCLIDPLLRPPERTYSFVSAGGGVIPVEDEQARRVVWDCKVPVQLRPANWIAIGHGR